MSCRGNCTLHCLMSALVLGCGTLTNLSALAATESVSVVTLTVGTSSASVATSVIFDGTYIWVAIRNPGSAAVEKLSLSGDLISTTQLAGTPIEMTSDGRNVWVSNYTSSSVSVVGENGIVLKTIPLPGAAPEGIMFDGRYIWTANNGAGANSVTKIDATTMTIVNTYSVGLAPDGVAFDGTNVWVTNSLDNNVWKIDRNSGAHLASYPTGIFPLSILFDGTNMWIGNGTGVDLGERVPDSGSLSKIRASDGANLGVFGVGNHVRGLVYDGTSIWTCNSDDNTVSRIRTAGLALLSTYPTGKAPRAMAFDGTSVWIANSGENTLTVIAPTGGNGSPGQVAAVALKPPVEVDGHPGRPANRPYPGRSAAPNGRLSRTPAKVVTVRTVLSGNGITSILGTLLADD